MADNELKVKITAESDQLRAGMDAASSHVRNAMTQMESSLAGSFRMMSSHVTSFLGVTVGIAGIGLLLKGFVRESSEAEGITNRLKYALEAQGYSWKDVGAAVTEFSESVQASTRFDNDEAKNALVQMTMYTQDLKQAMNGVTLAMDMSIRTGQDLASTTRLIGMAMGGNVMMLGRFLPEFRNLESVLGKDASQAEKAAYAMKILNEKFGGTAQADMESYSGKVKALENAWKDLQKLLGNVLIPTLKDSVDWMRQLVEKAQEAMGGGSLESKMMEAQKRWLFLRKSIAEEEKKGRESEKGDFWNLGSLGPALDKYLGFNVARQKSIATMKDEMAGLQIEIDRLSGLMDKSRPGGIGKPAGMKTGFEGDEAERARVLGAFRLQNESKILELQGREEEAIKKRHAAELLAETSPAKQAEIRKRQAAELAKFYEDNEEKILTAMVDAMEEANAIETRIQNEAGKRFKELMDQQVKEREDAADKAILASSEENETMLRLHGENLEKEKEVSRRIKEMAIEQEMALEASATDQAAEYYRKRFELGEISASELARVEIALSDSRFEAELKNLNQLLSMYELLPDKYAEIQNRISKLHQDRARDAGKIEGTLALETKKQWDSMIAPIKSAMDTTVKGIIMGTTTLQEGLNNLWQSILTSYINMLIQMGLEWIATQIFASTATKAIKADEAISVITANAGEAAAGAAASQASIPWAGPALAIAAAAAMMAMVLGYRSMASAAGGWDVDRTMMTMVHPQEMILPASLAEGVRSMVGGGGSGGGGETHLHLHPQVYALDGKGVKRFFKEHGNELLDGLKVPARNFRASSATRSWGK